MKKVKILTIMLIMISMIIGISHSVFARSYKIDEKNLNKEIRMDFSTLEGHDNVYCIEKRQRMKYDLVLSYKIKTKVEIDGEVAKIYTNKNGSFELEGVFTNSANNVLGAILTDGKIDGKQGFVNKKNGYKCGYGYWDSYKDESVYNDAQHGVYQYLSKWVKRAKEEGFRGFPSVKGGTSKTGSKVQVQAEAKAEEYSYKVTFYLLSCTTSGGGQNVMIVDPEDPTPSQEKVVVQKAWLDGENKYNTRPEEITVRLLANGEPCKTAVLNKDNDWIYIFNELEVFDENEERIQYTVEEVTVPDKHTSIIVGDMDSGYKITNRLKTELEVTKKWSDEDNLDDLRPSEITATLLANGTICKNEDGTDKTIKLSESEGWTGKFTDLYLYDLNGDEIDYTVQESVVSGYQELKYEKTVNEEGKIIYTMTNERKPNYEGYVEITGKVWLDRADGKANKINGTIDDDELGLGGIKVTLKDVNGNQFDVTSTTTTNSDGTYTIRVNYDNSQNVYKLYENQTTVNEKLKTAYVEFEYDAMKFTTVATATSGVNTSKAKEDETTRNNFDNAHSTVTTTTAHPDNWNDRIITAKTKEVISFETYTDKTTIKRDEVIKYCNGDGTYKHTNHNNAWEEIITGQHTCAECTGTSHTIRTFGVDVGIIQNVNLGLFEREQPKVGIFSDLSKVVVEMNKQRYTYLYGVRSKDFANVDIKTQFQNKDEYKYERPVNPADISFIQEETNKDAMSVFVTYEIELGNLSTTLPITVQSIINVYDLGYELPTIVKDGQNIEYTVSNIYGSNEFNEITLNNLNITVLPGQRSSKIEITYEVSKDEIRGLFAGNASLHNAVEIHTYSTTYGESTLYAEQRTGGRTGNAYGGYDYETHPGNAAIKKETVTYTDKENNEYKAEVLKSTENLVEYIAGKFGPERDTDISPSFILFKDVEPKVLSGKVWEDTDIDNGKGTDNFRLGDGKKSDSEKNVANVKVELLKVNDDGSTVLANLYKEDGTTIPAVAYSNSQGNYSFGNIEEKCGVVTDKYVMKFTYGDELPTTIESIEINARDYKSTIISPDTEVYNVFKGTNTSLDWHLNIPVGYSVAVDDIEMRVNLEDLQYSNFNNTLNMTAYSKPFMMQVEFNPTEDKTEYVSENGETAFGKELNVFDFGIIERAREDLYVEKTINYVKITLPNGQELLEGDPTTDNISYTKAMGLRQVISNGYQAKNALEKQILIEMDSELIQNSQLNFTYLITVTNNSERDYDYYVNGEYKTEYYIFGTNNEGAPEIRSSVNCLVDYIDTDYEYTWEKPDNWTMVNPQELKDKGLISEATYTTLISTNKYAAYINSQFSELAPGEKASTYANASKLLANKEENVYENHIEILQIDSKTARTVRASEDGRTAISKNYKPGNYIPSLEDRRIDSDVNLEAVGQHEQDDDRINIIITNSTGVTNYTTIYIIAGLVGLMVMIAGIIFIKKKVLTK